MKPYGLSVSMRAASTGSCDAGKECWDETWVAYSFLILFFSSHLLSFSSLFFMFFCSLLLLLPPVVLCPSLCPRVASPRLSSPCSYALSSLFHPSAPSSLLLSFHLLSSLRLFPSPFFCNYTHSSVLFLLPSPLPSTLVPVVFTFPSHSPNKIKWCETIHFHIFLWSPERRLWPDLNLHVRERI